MDPNVVPLYDAEAGRTIGTKSDHERTQRMLCTLALGEKIPVAECGG
jgi:hypothetical protein